MDCHEALMARRRKKARAAKKEADETNRPLPPLPSNYASEKVSTEAAVSPSLASPVGRKKENEQASPSAATGRSSPKLKDEHNEISQGIVGADVQTSADPPKLATKFSWEIDKQAGDAAEVSIGGWL